jgi:hypothetical protein
MWKGTPLSSTSSGHIRLTHPNPKTNISWNREGQNTVDRLKSNTEDPGQSGHMPKVRSLRYQWEWRALSVSNNSNQASKLSQRKGRGPAHA